MGAELLLRRLKPGLCMPLFALQAGTKAGYLDTVNDIMAGFLLKEGKPSAWKGGKPKSGQKQSRWVWRGALKVRRALPLPYENFRGYGESCCRHLSFSFFRDDS